MKINLTIVIIFLSYVAMGETLMPAKSAHKTASSYCVTVKEQTLAAFLAKVINGISNASDIGKYKIIVELEDNELEFVKQVVAYLTDNGYMVARTAKNTLYIRW